MIDKHTHTQSCSEYDRRKRARRKLYFVSRIIFTSLISFKKKNYFINFYLNLIQGGNCKLCGGVTHLAKNCPKKYSHEAGGDESHADGKFSGFQLMICYMANSTTKF